VLTASFVSAHALITGWLVIILDLLAFLLFYDLVAYVLGLFLVYVLDCADKFLLSLLGHG
jgi:hypothetical protein